MRHAAYSRFVKHEVASSNDLSESEIQDMLEAWEHHESPFLPSERAMRECSEFAVAYQKEHGQTEMRLDALDLLQKFAKGGG